MLGKIIGGYMGAKAAKNARGGVDAKGGAVLGMAAMAITRRFGLPGFIAASAGGYALKRYNEKKRQQALRGKPQR